MKLDPVGSGRTPDEHVFALVQMEEDAVADHVTIITAGDKLLGLVVRKVLERIDGEVGKQFDAIRAFNENIHHVVGLVEKDAGLSPGALFVAPVAEFGCDHGIDIGAYPGITQHLYRISGALQNIFQTFFRHIPLLPVR